MAADLSLRFSANKLGKSLDGLSTSVERELNSAVKDLANAAFAKIMANVKQSTSSPDYAKGLKFFDLGNGSYMISLDGEWANKLENGYPAYSIRDMLLQSKKIVQVGSRQGEPWVQKGKKGQSYAHVPFEHKQNTTGAKGGDLGTDIGQMFVKNMQGRSQSLKRTFKDLDGNPLSGKVATVTDAINDKFQGITKYQYVHPSGRVTSTYLTYRTVSSAAKDWIHPGFSGFNFFKDAEDFVEKELENIVKTLLK